MTPRLDYPLRTLATQAPHQPQAQAQGRLGAVGCGE